MLSSRTSVIYGVIAMAAIVVLSNILVQFLLGNWLTYGALTYPLAFLVTDIINRTFGAKQARLVVLIGFMVGVACSLVASQLTNADGYALTTLRIALGSGVAFLAAQLIDISVFNHLRNVTSWWKAPLVSSFVGSAIDTALFFFIAFSATLIVLETANPSAWAQELVPLLGLGPVLPLWVSLAVADFMVKMTLAGLALLPYRLITRSH